MHYVNSKTCYTKQALRDMFKISKGRYRWFWKCIGEFMRVFVLRTRRQQTRLKGEVNFL
jgi:hypothetical protein